MLLKRLLPVLVLAALAPHEAAATVWTVTNDATLTAANAGVVAGDIVRISAGTYTVPIRPQRNGTAGARIYYYGNQANPTAATVNGIFFGYENDGANHTCGDYVTVKWVASSNNIGSPYHLRSGGWYACMYDSLVKSTVTNGGLICIGKANVYDSLSVTGVDDRITMLDDIGTLRPSSNLVKNSTFNYTHNAASDFQFIEFYRAQYNTFLNNTFNFTVNSTGGYCFALEMYRSYYNSFQNNTWNVVMNQTPSGTKGLWAYRDSSSYNRFVGNRLTQSGPGTISLGLAQDGSFIASTNHNYLGNNTIRIGAPIVGNGGICWQGGSRQDTLEFNTFIVSGATVLFIANGKDFTGTVVRHNTFYGTTPTLFDVSSASNVSGNRLSSNLFYSTAANGSGSSASIRVPASGVSLDSLGLVFNRGGSAGNAISLGGSMGAPGSGGSYGQSGKAAWNTPMFTDSSYATLNTTLLAGSPAQSAGFQDGFAGSLGTPTADVSAPSTVSTLTTTGSTSNTVSLRWTAVGDDGGSGIASVYDLRYSTSPITSGNFAGATAYGGVPAPQPSGATENVTVTGLSPNTTYYFALVVRDEAGNASGVSNTVSLATAAAADVTPPGAIPDLRTN